MTKQDRLHADKAVVRAWVREHFPDEKLAAVCAFNADGRMGYLDSCGCLLGVTGSETLHTKYECPENESSIDGHYRAVWKDPAAKIAEMAYCGLAVHATVADGDYVRKRVFSAILRAEMRRRDAIRIIAQSIREQVVV